MSPNGGVPKHPQASIFIGEHGVDGDYHSGPINRHKKTGPPETNARQLTLVALEVLEELNKRLSIALQPGNLGENITTSGLGDLAQLQKGDRLQFGANVILEITEQNKPCTVLNVYHPTIVREIAGKRGVAAIVVNSGTIQPGDTCLNLSQQK
jgi:MOSC domain-containing protein YiiM